MNVITLTRIAVPVSRDAGLNSPVSGHFGKAPGFVIVNSDGTELCFYDSKDIRGVSECAPIEALKKLGADAVVARSMGRGALRRCHEAGLQIFRSEAATVAELLIAYRKRLCIDFPNTAICDHQEEHDHSHDQCCSEHD